MPHDTDYDNEYELPPFLFGYLVGLLTVLGPLLLVLIVRSLR